MFRSLHMKMMLVMILLIMSLMTVTGIFLINSVADFYLKEFYSQMSTAFADQDFAAALLHSEEEGKEGSQVIKDVLEANVGALGVDSRNRNYYILDSSGNYLDSSDDDSSVPVLQSTPNLLTALGGEPGYSSDVASSYMDVAIPIDREDGSYIIYIRDNRATASELNAELSTLIIEALIFGLAISILLSFVLSKAMIIPIELLTDSAKRLADGDFSHKLEPGSRDEIGVLTTTFNDMANQLQVTLQEVENERNKLGTLFLHMTDGVVAFSSDGAVIHANPAAAEMLGREIQPWDRYEDFFGDISSLDNLLHLDQSNCVTGERQVNGKSLELLLAPFSGQGQGGVMAVIHDVTIQRKTEEERKEFVANVSHELRTPLTNIRSYAETLAEAGGDIPPAMQASFFDVILSESDRMTHIVQDLLTLSRFDSGRSEMNLTRFPLAKAVRDIYNAVLLDAQRHGHRLELALAPELPEIVADRERLAQVMMNVVSNSIKYTPDGGHIRMSAGVAQDGQHVWIEVADNGIGIPEADRGRIFDRFYRVDKARSRQSGGTGLGLSIAKEIITLHKGAIELVDTGLPGLTVRITLWIEGPEHG